MAKDRRPKVAETPRLGKVPKWRDPLIGGEKPLSWRFSHCDRGGPFSWTHMTAEQLYSVVDRLAEFEGKTWEQILDTRSHRVECGNLCGDATSRLVAIGHDDLDEMMSFRIKGASRVWCISDGSIMRVLWWDPNHLVHPTPPDKADRRKRKRR